MEKLAIHGGTPVIVSPPADLFRWPIITPEDEAAALEVIRNNSFSGTDLTIQFEKEFAQWLGCSHALAFSSGTMSLTAAMFAAGLGMGDEIICPTKTYWASVTQAFSFGATPVFANIDEHFVLDPTDLERCISPHTRAIMAVHYSGYPCDMDPIMEIARQHNIIVIEDVSHAQGGLYKGRRLGTIGDVAAMSLMSGKSFAAGELGILVTNNRKLYDRAVAYAHYERNNAGWLESEDLAPYAGIALGGMKGRANQLCVTLARGQLKHYDERCVQIRRAMNRFWDLLDGLPGLYAVRADESVGSNMAGWYNAIGGYRPEELGGLPVGKFCEALRAEGVSTWDGANWCLHTHNLFKTMDLYHAGKPTRIVHAHRDVRLLDDACRPSEERCCLTVPWFKYYDEEWIARYAHAFRKVIENHASLLDPSSSGMKQGGRWYGTAGN
ncbi:MAG: aminotransferase class V-fold PLP-dependent enzyme [Clostridia bacterium]|nr:aminotransferase class V-fold PLP-dependent enzyme [Clostridia bacterium]